MTQRIAIYPGTFDPITYGHTDIIRRAAPLFDRLIIGVAENKRKKPVFSLEERAAQVRAETASWSTVSVTPFSGLLVDFAKSQGASVILRGLRVVSDFEFEIQMSSFNHQLEPTIETLFLSPLPKYAYLSSTMVRDVARHHGDLSAFVSTDIATALYEKLAESRDGA